MKDGESEGDGGEREREREREKGRWGGAERKDEQEILKTRKMWEKKRDDINKEMRGRENKDKRWEKN